jgi:hypothetical protein
VLRPRPGATFRHDLGRNAAQIWRAEGFFSPGGSMQRQWAAVSTAKMHLRRGSQSFASSPPALAIYSGLQVLRISSRQATPTWMSKRFR